MRACALTVEGAAVDEHEAGVGQAHGAALRAGVALWSPCGPSPPCLPPRRCATCAPFTPYACPSGEAGRAPGATLKVPDGGPPPLFTPPSPPPPRAGARPETLSPPHIGIRKPLYRGFRGGTQSSSAECTVQWEPLHSGGVPVLCGWCARSVAGTAQARQQRGYPSCPPMPQQPQTWCRRRVRQPSGAHRAPRARASVGNERAVGDRLCCEGLELELRTK
jgi:hypothetical protein